MVWLLDDCREVLAQIELFLDGELDAALECLAREHERPARVLEMRFFGGMTEKEVGEVLQVSRTTVAKDWQFARGWLRRRLS